MTNIDSQLALVPASLQMLLKPIVKTDERVAVWGQHFIKACKPYQQQTDRITHHHVSPHR